MVAFTVGGVVWWLWAMWMRHEVLGLIGLGIGLLTISDLALPFVWHSHAGVWPGPWMATFAGLVVLRLIGMGAAAAAEALAERQPAMAARSDRPGQAE